MLESGRVIIQNYMTVFEIMTFLESKGSEQTRKIYAKHGAPEGFYGVKVSDLKTIVKKVKTNHELALELFDTGNSDAMYLAGLIADSNEFTEETFLKWAQNSEWYMIAEYAMAWNLAESPLCMDICMKWIDSNVALLQETAWAALGCRLSFVSNESIDFNVQKTLLTRVEQQIHSSLNRTKYCMNGFVIALGTSIPELTKTCKEVGDRIGKVEVLMGDTSCKVPLIRPYIEKIEARGSVGKKKKTLKC